MSRAIDRLLRGARWLAGWAEDLAATAALLWILCRREARDQWRRELGEGPA